MKHKEYKHCMSYTIFNLIALVPVKKVGKMRSILIHDIAQQMLSMYKLL